MFCFSFLLIHTSFQIPPLSSSASPVGPSLPHPSSTKSHYPPRSPASSLELSAFFQVIRSSTLPYLLPLAVQLLIYVKSSKESLNSYLTCSTLFQQLLWVTYSFLPVCFWISPPSALTLYTCIVYRVRAEGGDIQKQTGKNE